MPRQKGNAWSRPKVKMKSWEYMVASRKESQALVY